MKNIIFALILFPVLTFAKTVEIEVPDMVCQMCVQSMKKNFLEVVKDANDDVNVNLETKIVTVNLSQEISEEEINKRVKNAGYKVQKITWSQDKEEEKN